MITLDWLYIPVGLMFAVYAVSHGLDSKNPARWRSALFWSLFSSTFLFGSYLSDLANGCLLIALVVLATLGLKPGTVAAAGETLPAAAAPKISNAIFIPALIVPATTLAGSLLMPDGRFGGLQLIAPKQVTLAFLAIGALLALVVAISMMRPPARSLVHDGRVLVDTIGWALMLPQMLAALGAIFALAHVGDAVSTLLVSHLHIGQAWMAAGLYVVGMAAMTMVMGNAFAAFPVMTAGIGIPLLMQHFGCDPRIMCAIGMLSGFCGTLMTPMAANFNIVPAAMLQLRDRNAVIKAQMPTALCLLVVNAAVLSIFGFSK